MKTDAKIIFCEVTKNNLLYIGTNDSILRVYEIIAENSLKLMKILACSYQEYSKVTHFCTTSNPEVLLFV